MKKLLIILKYTFIEIYRSKILVGLLFLSFGLVLVSSVAAEFAYAASAKVTLDVGMGILSLSNLGIAIFLGATLLSKEIEQKTLYMILSRPISRASFLIGKILGLSSILLINTVVLGGITILLYVYRGGVVGELFGWTLLFIFLEAFIVLLFAVLFSLITNTTLSVIFTVIIYIVGHAFNETSKILFAKMSTFVSFVLDFIRIILPNFYKLNVKDFLIYEQSISLNYFLGIQGYALLYSLALVGLIIMVFNNKNLD